MHDACEAFRQAVEDRLGYSPDDIEPGKLMRFATRERRSDKAGWAKLFEDERGGVFGCYRQGISETWSAVERQSMTAEERAAHDRQIVQARAEREAQQRERWAANMLRIAKLWEASRPLVPGDPATLYLKRRGLGGLWPLPQCLRLHRSLGYWEDGQEIGRFPTMVAPLIGSDGRMLALHRTFLTADGRKADVDSPRKLTGAAGLLGGSCIPLHKPVRGSLGIAEGIETALAAWAGSGVPVQAAYSGGNLAAWRWPEGLQRLVIFGDADEAGRKAAAELKARAVRAGLRCDALFPFDEGSDWLDVWASRRPIVVEGCGP